MTPDVQVCNTVYEPQCTTVQDEKCEIRYEDKCETKYEVNIIQNDSIWRRGGYYRLRFYFQDKCETKYDSVCRDVQVFCQNFLQIEADCFRLQDTQCQTFEETKCDKELKTAEIFNFILFLTFFFRVQVYEDKCSVTYETEYEEVCTTKQEQKCEARITWKLRHTTCCHDFYFAFYTNDFIVSISNP